MNSLQDKTPRHVAVADGQAAEAAIVACPKCGANPLKSGVVTVATSYQSYRRSAGKLMKTHAGQAGFQYVECALCRERLSTTIEVLVAMRAEVQQLALPEAEA